MRAREQGRRVNLVESFHNVSSTHARAGAGTTGFGSTSESGKRLRPCARGSRDAVSTHGGGVCLWVSRFDRTRSNGNFVHLLPERLATSRIWSRCHEGFPALQATGQKRELTRYDNL